MNKRLEILNTVLLVVILVIGVAMFSAVNGDGAFGARTANPTTLDADEWTQMNDLAVDDLEVGGHAYISGASTFVGASSFTGAVDFGSGVIYDVESITGTTTLTNASGNFIVFPASADQITVTLPASTTVGAVYTFVVTGALTGPSVTIKSAEVSNIQGILMVNDADVVCSDEDQLNIITDGEVIGDRVQLMSDGTNWIILDSDIDAASKMTCTT